MISRLVSPVACLVAILIVYVGLAGLLAYSRSPYCDEAYLASPAYNLIHHGYMGTSILDETSNWNIGMSLRGINRYTYQVMPLHFLTQAVWYKLTGFGLGQMRALSIFWGMVALVSLYALVRTSMGTAQPALWTAGLLAVDAVVLTGASSGRADMAAAALGFAGLAAYMTLQERHLTVAVVCSNCLIAGAVFTHPMAAPAFPCLIALALLYSLKRIRFHHLLLAAVPYVVIAGGWGLYIMQAPAVFREQFGSNAAGRFSGLVRPWTLVARELRLRYLDAFGYGPGVSAAARLKLLILLAYAAAILGCLLTPALRRQKGCRALLLLATIYIAVLTVLDGTKQQFYLVETIPLCTAILATWLWWVWDRRAMHRGLVALAVVGLVGIQLSRTYHIWRVDAFHHQFLPAVEALRHEATEDGLIMGSATFAFSLGFDNSHLIDDLRLGYRTHKRPETIVLDDRYDEWLGVVKTREPETWRYMEELLSREYRVVYDREGYRIYRQELRP